MSEDQKKQLEQQLWNIANTLRGKMNADEFRDYILGFIFYKYLAEKMEIFANDILKQDNLKFRNLIGSDEETLEIIDAVKEEALEKLGYFLKPDELFSEVAKRGNSDVEGVSSFILEDLQKILTNIQLSTMGTESEEDFDNLFEDMDLNSTKLGKSPEARNEIISKVLSHLDNIDFKLEHTELDVLGDAYEYLIGQFASGAGKKAGEFYTPQEVSMVLAKLVTTGKEKLKSVYDPTCGSGSLLLRVAKEVKEVGDFYGQEMNRTTYNLARMNMILHGVHYRKFDIKQEDTLEHPQHRDMTFEAIVANPPFSAQWSANPILTTDDRFSQYGKLAPSSKADFAFVQHMIHHLAENGTMAIVLPHGVLFRGGAEQHIRKYLIENRNYLDAVIGLPANIFYGTSIPTCILVFKKCKENPEDILFIDASQHFDKVKTQNVLREEHINKIVAAYRNRTEEDKYSKRVPLQLIADNDYNLNIARYVDTFEAEEKLDINKICYHLEELNNLSKQNDEILKSFCRTLNIPFPNGFNLSLLQQYKKGVMQKIFSQELRFKDDKGNDFVDWEEKTIGDVLSIGSGKDYKHLKDGSVPVFGTGGLMTYVDDFLFDGETVCIGRKGTIDKPMYFKGKIWTVDTLFFTHKFVNSIPKYIFYVFQNINWKLYNEASGVPSLSKSTIEKILIDNPCIEEQTKIANFLSAIDDKINHCQSQIEKTAVWKKGLLQQLFV